MSDNKVTGKIIKIGDVEQISGGKYEKIIFVVRNNDGYNGEEKDYAFEIFAKSGDDKITNFVKYNKVGYNVDVSYNLDCRESKDGRWFTSLKAWNIDRRASDATPSPEQVREEDVPLDDDIEF